MRLMMLIFLAIFFLGGCGEKQQSERQSSMKCGAGKCGANMFDASSALGKKKANILSQMAEDDERRDCVIKANTTKTLYNCVRNPKTGKLSLKCGGNVKEEVMKCGAGKCGSGM